MADLRVVSARIMKALREAPRIPGHPYFNFEHPSSWEDVKAAMPAAKGYKPLSDGRTIRSPHPAGMDRSACRCLLWHSH